MRLRRGLWVLLGLLLAPSSANGAPLPSCSPAQFPPDRQEFHAKLAFFDDTITQASNVPRRVVIGKMTPVTVYIGLSDDRAGENATVVSLEAVSGAPLANPVTLTFGTEAEAFPRIGVLLTATDGPTYIRQTFTYKTSGTPSSSCRATVVSPVMEPVKSQVTFSDRYPRRNDIFDNDRTTGIEFVPRRAFCGPGKRLSYSASYAGSTVTVTASSGCDIPAALRTGRKGLALQTFKSDGSAYIWVRRRAIFDGTVRYVIRLGEKVIRSGTFRVRGRFHRGARPTKGYRIYESDFDNYVNTCINEGYRTYASGGQLYCYISGSSGTPSYYYQRVTRLN